MFFIFCYPPTLHIRDFHVRYYRTPPFYWERTVSVCIMTLYSVFVLCVFPPPLSFYSSRILLAYFPSVSMYAPSMFYIIPRHPFGWLYIWRALYFWRNISIWRALSVLRAPSSFLFFPSSKASITLTLRYQLRQ